MFREQQSSWGERSTFRPYLGPWPSDAVPAEEWRRIPGYPDYEVSDQGRVRSYKRGPAPRLMKVRYQKGGGRHRQGDNHLAVALSVDGELKFVKVHRLVALAFVPNPLGKPFVAHDDGNPLNNRATNLRWKTHQENMRDKVTHRTSRNGATIPDEKVLAMRKLFGVMSDYAIAELFGVTRMAVRQIRTGKRRAGVK